MSFITLQVLLLCACPLALQLCCRLLFKVIWRSLAVLMQIGHQTLAIVTVFSGYCFFFNGSLVSWSSVKQRVIALLSMEAEYYAMTHALNEGIWMHLFLSLLNLPVPKPFSLFCDNQAMISLLSSESISSHSKHIDIKHHFIYSHVLIVLFPLPGFQLLICLLTFLQNNFLYPFLLNIETLLDFFPLLFDFFSSSHVDSIFCRGVLSLVPIAGTSTVTWSDTLLISRGRTSLILQLFYPDADRCEYRHSLFLLISITHIH